ncbi:MAG: hypothetical protein ACT4PE_07865 [Candidatus Eiseniibacteriota bacterium]
MDTFAKDVLRQQFGAAHVQHHTGQLNLILRQRTDSAPSWVTQAKREVA